MVYRSHVVARHVLGVNCQEYSVIIRNRLGRAALENDEGALEQN